MRNGKVARRYPLAAMIASSMPAVMGDEAATNVKMSEVVDVAVTPSYVTLNPCPDNTSR